MSNESCFDSCHSSISFPVFDSNGKRPNGLMLDNAHFCWAWSQVSQSPCPEVFNSWNPPNGYVHAEGQLHVSFLIDTKQLVLYQASLNFSNVSPRRVPILRADMSMQNWCTTTLTDMGFLPPSSLVLPLPCCPTQPSRGEGGTGLRTSWRHCRSILCWTFSKTSSQRRG